MSTLARRSTAFWMRFTEPLILRSKGHLATARALRAARIARFPEWYVAMSYLVSTLFGLASAVASWAALGVFGTWPRLGLGLAAGALGFLFVRLGFLSYPRVVAAGRARRIDEELPSVVTFSYALARGGMDPLEIFRTVAKEKHAYGEAAVEFGVVVRNVEWFGMDLIAALKDTASTTPSRDLRSFFDGLVTILNSGAEPRDYFKNQAENRLKQAALGLEAELEQTSMLAEIYVSGLLVLPLLLLVVLSGLAPLAPGQDALIPFIVFAMIPLGTAVYLVLLETLLPPENLAVPLMDPAPTVDFGMHSLPSATPLLPPPWRTAGEVENAHGAAVAMDEKALRSLRWRLFVERQRSRASAWFARHAKRIMMKPLDALEVSGFVGLAILGTAGWYAWQNAPTNEALIWSLTGAVLLAGSVALLPVSIFHEIRVHRARKIDKALPPTLNSLAGFNERGISLLQSFQILGNSSSGPLTTELRAVGQDVTWNSSLAGALRRLRTRVNTVRMTKLSLLLERASAATGNLREMLDIAAEDATRTEHLRATKRQSMMSYVVVVYLVFAVFLYVLYVVANLFYGPEGLGAAAANAGSGALSAALQPAEAKMLFAEAAVIQGLGCGLVAGRLGEGHLLSGVKHSAILAIASFLIFHFGVI